MDPELLVGERGEAGQRLLVDLVRAGVDVTAAAWFRSAENGQWRLYVVSPAVRSGTTGAAYNTFYRCLFDLPGRPLDSLTVRLVPDTDRVARYMEEVRDRFPGRRVPIRLTDGEIGGFAFSDAYLYPPVTTGLTRDEVVSTVADLIRRGNPGWPSRVTLRDGRVVVGIPYGLEQRHPGATPAGLDVKIRDDAAGTTLVVPADEVANIQ